MDRSGVYDDLACDNKVVNHGVVVVGYLRSQWNKLLDRSQYMGHELGK